MQTFGCFLKPAGLPKARTHYNDVRLSMSHIDVLQKSADLQRIVAKPKQSGCLEILFAKAQCYLGRTHACGILASLSIEPSSVPLPFPYMSSP